MNPILLVCCWLTRAWPDLVAESNSFDRMTVVANAIALLTLAVLSVLAWGVFFGTFLELRVALPLAILVAAIIVQLEAAIAASDWQLAGVLRLRNEPPGLWHWLKLVIRLLVALVFSGFTAMGVMLALFGETIGAQLQAKRAAHNAPLEREYAARKEELKSRLIVPLESELKAAREARALEAERVRALRARHQSLLDQASRASIEAGRELDGLGRLAGAGPRYRDALRQREQSAQLAERSAAELEHGSSALRDLDGRLENLNRQLAAGNADLAAAWRALDQAKLRDARWMRERDDALLRVIALFELANHSEYGPVVRRFTWMAALLLVLMELCFLLIKVVFAPASVYTVRVIAKTKEEAAQVAAEHARRREAIRREYPRAKLRIVERAEQPQPDAAHGAGERGNFDPPPPDATAAEIPRPSAGTGAQPADAANGGDFSERVPVIGAIPPREIALRDALADDGAYYVERETRRVYSRPYWEALNEGSPDSRD
jgi:hypothetical protein